MAVLKLHAEFGPREGFYDFSGKFDNFLLVFGASGTVRVSLGDLCVFLATSHKLLLNYIKKSPKSKDIYVSIF